MKTFLVPLAICAVIIIGCAGHGSSSATGTTGSTTSTGSTTGTTGSVPPSTVRQNENGDSFVYSVTGVYSQTGVTSNVPATGTATEGFQTETFNGATVLSDIFATNLQVGASAVNFADTKLLNANGATMAQSDDEASSAGAPFIVTNGAFAQLTQLSSTFTFSGTEGLMDGTTIQLSLSVTGYQMVTTAAGSFDCWTLSKSVTWSDGLTQTETIQFSPALGAVIQRVETDNKLNAYSYTITESLTSYSIGPQAR